MIELPSAFDASAITAVIFGICTYLCCWLLHCLFNTLGRVRSLAGQVVTITASLVVSAVIGLGVAVITDTRAPQDSTPSPSTRTIQGEAIKVVDQRDEYYGTILVFELDGETYTVYESGIARTMQSRPSGPIDAADTPNLELP